MDHNHCHIRSPASVPRQHGHPYLGQFDSLSIPNSNLSKDDYSLRSESRGRLKSFQESKEA